MNNSTQFKKGDLVTLIGSWDQFGTVYVRHYRVTSWGKKQATLVRVDDGSNAEFRVYTQHANALQGVRSRAVIPTADYTEERALELAREFIANEGERADSRYAKAQERASKPGYVPYGNWSAADEFALEQRIYDQHKAVPFKAEIRAE